MADARDSKSRGPQDHEGSSPSSGTETPGSGALGGDPMIHPELLEILCCPETRQPVREAPKHLVESVNRAIQDGGFAGGDAPSPGPLDGGLLREDGKFLYPVRNGIPIMLIEERIAVSPPPPGASRETASGENVEDDRDAGHHPVEAGARA